MMSHGDSSKLFYFILILRFELEGRKEAEILQYDVLGSRNFTI